MGGDFIYRESVVKDETKNKCEVTLMTILLEGG